MSVSTKLVGSIAVVCIDNPPVNAVSVNVREGLVAAIDSTNSNPKVTAVVLHCTGRTFIAGADIKEFTNTPLEPHLPNVVFKLEHASKPWVGALHGTVLGGGLEVALGCHHRIADKDTSFGFPEVNLGLIPGAGGTVRLPRLIDPAMATTMIATGKPINAKKALEIGLIDKIASATLLDDAIALAKALEGTPKTLLSKPTNETADAAVLVNQFEKITARARQQQSPKAAVEAIQNALSMDAEAALLAERALFLRLKEGDQSKALRHVFFAERSAGRMPELKDVAPRSIEHIGVIGGGTMGAGIAASCLLAGLQVTMIEQDADSLKQGQARVHNILENSKSRGLISADKQAHLLQQFQGNTTYAALSDATVVVEAVFENIDVKLAVFNQLEEYTSTSCVLASNTSYIDINLIAKACKDPSRVIGLHFFSPAHVMKLVELIVTTEARPDVLATGLKLGKRLGKICVPAGVCEGFIGNRMMSAYRRECEFMIEDGTSPYAIDEAMREFGYPMGIFEMQDLAGLDIAWAMRKRLSETRDPHERYVDIADELCQLERFGRKSGKGWYNYDNGKAQPDSVVLELIDSERKRKAIVRQSLQSEDIMQRILSAQQTTGKTLLDEGIARNSADIDVVMINGYGFPRYKGGPMFMQSGSM